MDWNCIEEHWKKLKGKIKQQWAYLTDDDHLILNPIPRSDRQDAALLGMTWPRWRWNHVLLYGIGCKVADKRCRARSRSKGSANRR